MVVGHIDAVIRIRTSDGEIWNRCASTLEGNVRFCMIAIEPKIK